MTEYKSVIVVQTNEAGQPTNLLSLEDGDTISNDVLSPGVRNAASGFDGVSATVYDNSATWDEGIDPATLADLVTASARTDTLVTFSASVETSTADLATSTTDISGYINANQAGWAAGIDAGTLDDITSVSATVKDTSGDLVNASSTFNTFSGDIQVCTVYVSGVVDDNTTNIGILDASTTALNIWSGTVDTSVVDLDADITTLDGRVVTVESLVPSAAGFADWNATKATVDAGAANWDNPSGTASAMGAYLGSSVAISGFGPGDATPTGPIANQYLAFKASDSRFRYVEPPLRFTTTDQVSINPLGMLDLEGGGGTANSFGLDIGLSLSGWVNQNDYDITVTPGLPNSYTIDIDFDQSQQQTANLTAVSANGSTLGINFSNISAGRKVNLTILNPTYTITTIPVIAGATWMTTSLSNLAAGETVEIIIYSRGSTTSDLYLYSTQLDHGDLQGLLDDDHTQYFNDTRLQAKLAGTSFPGSPYDGQPFYRTDLDDNFWYDSTRSKWLGGPRNHTLGFTANLVLNAYMKHAGNVTGAATAGEPMVYDSTLVGWSYCVNAIAAGSFELYVNGSATGITISHASSTTGNDQTVNYNLAANDIVTVRNVSGASVAAPVINLIIKRRAS
jgi:hypothetical protein